MTLTCLVKKQMAGSTLNKGVFGHFLFLVNYSGFMNPPATETGYGCLDEILDFDRLKTDPSSQVWSL